MVVREQPRRRTGRQQTVVAGRFRAHILARPIGAQVLVQGGRIGHVGGPGVCGDRTG